MVLPSSIIFFDGICNLCNSLVTFTIKRDKAQKFKFAPLQSETANSILKTKKIQDTTNSFVLIHNDTIYTKSTATLILLKELGSLWKLFYIFIIIPRPIRDYFYDLIAKNRYKMFGSRSACMRPTDELKHRFL